MIPPGVKSYTILLSDLEIGDSDEEILNKVNPNENEEDGQLQVSVFYT